MINKEVLDLAMSLKEFSNIKGKEFAYLILKNKKILEEELKVLEQLKREPHPEFENYEKKRIEICEKYSDKDENGRPKMNNGQYVINKHMTHFVNEINTLKTEYPEVIKEVEETDKEFRDFLNSESKADLIKIPADKIPEDIDVKLLVSIKKLIDGKIKMSKLPEDIDLSALEYLEDIVEFDN